VLGPPLKFKLLRYVIVFFFLRLHVYKNPILNVGFCPVVFTVGSSLKLGAVGVRTVMENLEKSWNFKIVISRPEKVMEKNINHNSFGKVTEYLLSSHVHLRGV